MRQWVVSLPKWLRYRFLARYLWAMRLARLYEALPLSCPGWRSREADHAFITEAVAGRAILEHIGEPATPPRITSARGPPEWYGDSEDASICIEEEGVSGDPLAQREPEYAYDQRVTG